MSDTPKYVGLIKSSDDGEFLITDTHATETPTRAELEEHLTECLANEGYGQDRVAELYIRERDTRRQFSPEQVREINQRLWAQYSVNIGDLDSEALCVINHILEEYRKLIHEP